MVTPDVTRTATPCSAASLGVAEPLAGTAPHALTWVAVEEPGPWGRDALHDSPLPDALRATLRQFKEVGIGVVLIRRHDQRTPVHERTVLVARTAPGGTLLRRGRTVAGDELATWDRQALAAGQLPAFGETSREPVVLVCTHGKRDACCARLGRSFVEALLTVASAQAGQIWECSHIGGHRFAAVTLTLPHGIVHGRLTAEDAPRVVEALESASVLPDSMRGRTCFPAPLQAAGIAVRQLVGETRADALDVLALAGERAVPVDAGWAVPTVPIDLEVRHVDGRAWHVTIAPQQRSGQRPESCGAEPSRVHGWQATAPRAVERWR